MFRKMFFSFALMFIVTGAYSAYGQEAPPAQQPATQQKAPDASISDQELESFVKAAVKVEKIQKESEGEMVKAIQDEGLEPDRFVEINTIQQNPAADTENKVSEKELDNYNKAMKEVQSIQQGVQTEQVKAIEDEGLDVNRYVQIAKAVQQDPELMKKVQGMQTN